MFWNILLPFVLGTQLSSSPNENPTVTISQGTLKGRMETLKSGNHFYSFLGIPFAKPPLNDLRFKAPQPPESWKGTRDALHEGPTCMFAGDQGAEGSEDCLFLNVYTRNLDKSASLPVIFYVYGGGFKFGTSERETWNPTFLLEEEIIFVISNYRANVLGFISTEDDVLPGNLGLKDNVQALRWVNQNIAAFGGDPKKVTLMGHSSGAASVHYLMLSPMTKGLFRGALCASGLASNPWTLQMEPRRQAFFVGQELNFTGNSSQELVDFLRKRDAAELVKVADKTPPFKSAYQLFPMNFGPVVEKGKNNEETFLPEEPLKILQEGTFNQVPFLTGITTAEALIAMGPPALHILEDGKDRKFVNDNLLEFIQSELRYCKREPCGIEMARKVKDFYMGNRSIENDTLDDFVQMNSDSLFREGALHAVQNMSAVSSQPVYFYEFSFDGKLGYYKRTVMKTDFPGVAHGDDLGYVFDKELEPDQSSALTMQRMVKTWTTFARTGNPTIDMPGIPAWRPYKIGTDYYMSIDKDWTVKQNYRPKYMDFWKDLYRSG